MKTPIKKGMYALALLLLAGLTACGAEGTPVITATPLPPTETPEATINVVEYANLRQTAQIEIYETSEGAQTEYELVTTITGAEVIQELVDTLDTDVALGPRARCASLYLLRFHLEDDSTAAFGYACDLQNETFLRGQFGGEMGQDAQTPPDFDELIRPYLISEDE